MKRLFALLGLLFISNWEMLPAQPSVSPKYEFRGVWVATVTNLDFPYSQNASPAEQQTEIRRMFDNFKTLGINAIVFQVRTECDALYDSKLEPWSVYLTGEQGKAPSPLWDPLQFAIEEAHKRGMELHAWLNPFRVIRSNSSTYKKAANHISVTRPDWMLKVGNVTILDPGIPEAREYIINVAMDIVKRYDIDGLHYDDYFYPYDNINTRNEDTPTYEKYGKAQGFNDIKAWRLNNISSFVKTLQEQIQKAKPEIKHSVSPFGIHQNGVPSGITGLDAVNVLYTDIPTWLKEKWVDFLVPQLYWTFGGGQDYAKLAPWWASIMNGRHLYIGHGLYRADSGTFTGTLFTPNEVPRQIRFNRNNNITGSVFFRALNLSRYPSGGFADSLKLRLYKTPAITPSFAWKDQRAPSNPVNLLSFVVDREVALLWGKPITGDKNSEAVKYAIYRIETNDLATINNPTKDSRYLVGVTGETSFRDKPPKSTQSYYYMVTALSSNSIESVPAEDVIQIKGSTVSIEPAEQPKLFRLEQSYPNPFSNSAEIKFSLQKASYVTLRIYSSTGQEVRTLLKHNQIESGVSSQIWDGKNEQGQMVSNGIYLCVLEVNGMKTSRTMVKM